MFLSLLSINPAIAIAWVLAIVISLTVHEFSHALVGKWRGDKTAEREGRLTLNPLAHVDWMGFIAMLFLGFGWAKPVPFNPYNLRDPKWDSVKIALAGPFSNLIIATISAIILRSFLIAGNVELNLLVIFLILLTLINLFLLFFNIIPVHPLDGSKLFFALFDAPKYAALRQFVAFRGPQILFFLVIASLLTNIDIFFFVSRPAFATCNSLVGTDCLTLIYRVFGG